MSVYAVAGLLAAIASAEAAPGWRETLRRQCPEKRLDWLNPGILIDGIDAFRDSLPKERAARIEQDASSDLAGCEMGAGCVNAAYIRAIGRLGLTRPLAASVCTMPYRCTAPFTCGPDH